MSFNVIFHLPFLGLKSCSAAHCFSISCIGTSSIWLVRYLTNSIIKDNFRINHCNFGLFLVCCVLSLQVFLSKVYKKASSLNSTVGSDLYQIDRAWCFHTHFCHKFGAVMIGYDRNFWYRTLTKAMAACSALTARRLPSQEAKMGVKLSSRKSVATSGSTWTSTWTLQSSSPGYAMSRAISDSLGMAHQRIDFTKSWATSDQSELRTGRHT